MLRCPLFVASLGNPAPAYRHTLHSAGHTLLSGLQQAATYPPFSKSRAYANGFVSQGEKFTLWQSPTLMNVSGVAVVAAWRAFLKSLSHEERTIARLVVVHDELESSLGKIKIRNRGSARGHNGLKSVATSLGGMEYTRIGIGIGRPESRESKNVAEFVLKKMSPFELQRVSDGANEVLAILVKMSAREI